MVLEQEIINNYWNIPTPKSSSNNRTSNHSMFAFNEVIADYNAAILGSMSDTGDPEFDEMLDEVMAASGDICSITDLIRGRAKPRKLRKTKHTVPMTFVRFATKIGSRSQPVTIKALLDSGGSGTLVTEKFCTKLKSITGGQPQKWLTPAGAMHTTRKVKAKFSIPELNERTMIQWDVHVAKDLGNYDMIIGRDLMSDLGIDIQFSTDTVRWEDSYMPFKDADDDSITSYHIPDSNAVNSASSRIKDILDAKYEPADLDEVVAKSTHLSILEQGQLKDLLTKYSSLFDGTLGKWKGDPLDIELKKDAEPYHARAFPIPKVHTETLKHEVDRLVALGVLKKVNRSEWAAPTFIIPKKDGTVRFITDFRELNKRIRRLPYPIPKIQDLLLKLEGFRYATSLDLNMGYYHIELTPFAKRMCTIVLPFGKYEYQKLPMGLASSVDVFQEKMSELMQDLEFVRVYLDDLLTLTKGTFEDHLEKLEEVLKRLKDVGLKVNAKKSFFACGELEYLGYWITRDGIQPLQNKVEAIHRIAAPKTRKQLRAFLGLVNYYRDMWQHRSHAIAPLTELTSDKVKFKWGPVQQEAFNNVKKIIARETLLAYPDFNKPFEVHTDASHLQLGAVISQDGKPIAFYSRKLLDAQTRYV